MQHDVDGMEHSVGIGLRQSIAPLLLLVACALYHQSCCCYLLSACCHGLRICIYLCLCSAGSWCIHQRIFVGKRMRSIRPTTRTSIYLHRRDSTPRTGPRISRRNVNWRPRRQTKASREDPRPAPRPSRVLLYLLSCSIGSECARNAPNKSGVCS